MGKFYKLILWANFYQLILQGDFKRGFSGGPKSFVGGLKPFFAIYLGFWGSQKIGQKSYKLNLWGLFKRGFSGDPEISVGALKPFFAI